jgi:cytochrome c-type biogenesis protein CcmE
VLRQPRILIALSVSMVLVAVMGYTVVGGASRLVVTVAQLDQNAHGAAGQTVQLTGVVSRAQRRLGGATFTLRDDAGPQTVKVAYLGSVPDAFRDGRNVLVTGHVDSSTGVFVAQHDSLLTKCASKYSAQPSA